MTGTEWNRLGERIVQRRTELGMRTTKSLAEQTGLTPRMLGDIENGRRDNYAAGTLAQIELALKWQAGSIKGVLEGGDPTPISAAPNLRAAEPAPAARFEAPPHEAYFDRAERLLHHSRESTRSGDYLSAIHGLEGVQSTVELLIDRVTDIATNEIGDSHAIPATQAAQPDASTEGGSTQEASAGGDDEEAVRSRSESPPTADEPPAARTARILRRKVGKEVGGQPGV